MPIITQEHSETIEDLVKRRIKASLYDNMTPKPVKNIPTNTHGKCHQATCVMLNFLTMMYRTCRALRREEHARTRRGEQLSVSILLYMIRRCGAGVCRRVFEKFHVG